MVGGLFRQSEPERGRYDPGHSRSVYVLDLRNQRAAAFTNFGSSYLTVTVDRVERFYNIRKLEELHRLDIEE